MKGCLYRNYFGLFEPGEVPHSARHCYYYWAFFCTYIRCYICATFRHLHKQTHRSHTVIQSRWCRALLEIALGVYLVTRVICLISAISYFSFFMIKCRDYPGREATGEVGHHHYSSAGMEACVGWHRLLRYPVWSYPNRADRRDGRFRHQSWHWFGSFSEDHAARRCQLCEAVWPASRHHVHSHAHTEGQPGVPQLSSHHLHYPARCRTINLSIIYPDQISSKNQKKKKLYYT